MAQTRTASPVGLASSGIPRRRRLTWLGSAGSTAILIPRGSNSSGPGSLFEAGTVDDVGRYGRDLGKATGSDAHPADPWVGWVSDNWKAPGLQKKPEE